MAFASSSQIRARPLALPSLAARACRKPAQRPWQAVGLSRSTWYRRRAKAREQAVLAAREAVLDRLAWQLAELPAQLDRCAAAHAAMAAALN
jgi:hypothetical protein